MSEHKGLSTVKVTYRIKNRANSSFYGNYLSESKQQWLPTFNYGPDRIFETDSYEKCLEVISDFLPGQSVSIEKVYTTV